MKLKLAVVFLFAVPFALAQNDQPKPKGYAIFILGNIYTGVGGTSSFVIAIRAQAMAVRGDRIQAVGTDVEISALKGIDTKVVDLGGKFVMPGFNDAHQIGRAH